MAITSTENTSIHNLCISMFNAAPDAANLALVVGYYEANGNSITALADALAVNTNFTAQFTGLTDAAVATSMLANFGLVTGTTAGDNANTFVLNALTAGDSHATILKNANDYLTSGSADAMYANAVAELANKTTVAEYYSASAATATTFAELQAIVASVDETAASVTTANTAIDQIVADALPTTSTLLTTGVDILTGTAANDTFIADNTGATEMTSTADTINGAAGNDTIKIYSDGTISAAPALTSIENVEIYDEDTTLDMSTTSWASATNVTFTRNDGDSSVTLGTNATTVNLADMALDDAGANNGFTIAAAATATALTVGLDKITVGTSTADEDVTVTGAALTTLNVNTTGTASSFELLDAAAATTINLNAGVAFTVADGIATTGTAALTISGAGAVDIGALDADINTITATANTGGVTAAIGANVDTVFTGSAGADVITAGTTDALVVANTLAVDGGAGTDVLVIAETADIDTALDAARYTNFETVRTADSVNLGLISGVTALQISGGTSEVYSGLTATQAADVTFLADNTTSTVFTLATATGTTDSITMNLASATATTNVDVIGASVIGIETVNVNATTGTNTTGDTAFGFLANTADSVSAVNLTGTQDMTLNVVANTLDVVAVAIDASALTGTADFTLALNTGLVTGSSVTGSLNADIIAVSSVTGTTIDAGAGDDALTGSVADLVATGTNDNVINGGAGTDSLTLDDTTTTLTDNHFTNLSNLETLALSNTVGNLSITTGAAFNTSFASGATITTGVMATTKTTTVNAGLATVDMTITVDGTDLTGAATEDVTLTTGSGADTVTFTGDATYVGAVAGDAATIAVDTGAGVDTISITVGTLQANTTSQAMTINAGTGADTITVVKVSADDADSVAIYTVDAGDSTTTAWDTITGFDLATATIMSDGLDFTGTAAIGTVATSVNAGTIMSSSTTDGVVLFDDIESYTTALVINSTNLADAVAYLDANTATNDVVAFTYDSDASGTADATMVYHNGTTDSLVLLAADVSVDALITTNASAGTGDLFIA